LLGELRLLKVSEMDIIFFRGDARAGGGWKCGDNFMGTLLVDGMTNGALENSECFAV
jgi:hypothetical protein